MCILAKKKIKIIDSQKTKKKKLFFLATMAIVLEADFQES